MKKIALDSYVIVSDGKVIATSLSHDDVQIILYGTPKGQAHSIIHSRINFDNYEVQQAYDHSGEIKFQPVKVNLKFD